MEILWQPLSNHITSFVTVRYDVCVEIYGGGTVDQRQSAAIRHTLITALDGRRHTLCAKVTAGIPTHCALSSKPRPQHSHVMITEYRIRSLNTCVMSRKPRRMRISSEHEHVLRCKRRVAICRTRPLRAADFA